MHDLARALARFEGRHDVNKLLLVQSDDRRDAFVATVETVARRAYSGELSASAIARYYTAVRDKNEHSRRDQEHNHLAQPQCFCSASALCGRTRTALGVKQRNPCRRHQDTTSCCASE